MSGPSRAAALVCVAAVTAACGTARVGDAVGEPAAAPSSVPPGLEEVSPGWDEESDVASKPDAELSPSEMKALLRIKATRTARADGCRPDQLSGRFVGLDAALGHRYGRLELTNSADQPCTLYGHPGIGFRGEQGSAFKVGASRRDWREPPVGEQEVRLASGAQAWAHVEWTGDLAGAESEWASLMVVQLSVGQKPLPVAVNGDRREPATDDAAPGGPSTGDASADPVDIGMFTTVYVGPFRTATP